MSVTLLRQKVMDGVIEEAEAGVRDLFATLDRLRPEGLRYASTRVADSSTFVILFELADGVEVPVEPLEAGERDGALGDPHLGHRPTMPVRLISTSSDSSIAVTIRAAAL